TPPNAARILQGSGIDESLSQKGVEQAKLLRDRFEANDIKFDLIVCSTLKRAQETAAIIAEKQPNATLLAFNELKEINWGSWEGQKGVNLGPLLNSWRSGDMDACAPGGETVKEVEHRAVPKLYEILKSRPEEKILVVIHGRLLRIILGSILHHDLRRMNDYTHHNTSVNILDVLIGQGSLNISAVEREQKTMVAVKNVRQKRIQWLGEHNEKVNTHKSIDDNIDIEEEEEEMPFKIDSRVTTVQHDESVFFEPLVLDDFDHLPAHLRSPF
ncbi:hypothetical protein HK098_006305, partial [Nowakowskiella sp. JEL0407]